MFSHVSPWAYAYYKDKRCVIIGYEHVENLKKIVVALIPGGEIVISDVIDIRVDLKQIVDLTKPLPGDEWKSR